MKNQYIIMSNGHANLMGKILPILLLVLFLFSFGIQSTYSQQKQTLQKNSEKKALLEKKFVKADSLFWLAIKKDANEALKIARECDQLAGQIGSREKKIIALFNISNAYLVMQKLDSAELNIRNTIKMAELEADSLYFYKSQGILSNIYYYQQKLDESIELDLEVLKYFKKNKLQKDMLKTLNNLGGKYYTRGEMNISISYLIKALETATSLDDTYAIINISTNISNNFARLKNFEKAYSYLIKAYELAQSAGYNELLAKITLNLGQIMIEKNDYAQAEIYYKKALEYDSDKDPYFQGASHFGLSQIYKRNNNNEKARFHLNQSILNDKIIDNNNRLFDSYVNLADIYLTEKNYKLAYQTFENYADKFRPYGNISTLPSYLQKRIIASLGIKGETEILKDLYEYISLEDTLKEQQKYEVIAELEEKYQSRQKEAENQKLQAEQELQHATIRSQRNALIAGTIGLGLITLLSVALYRISRKRKIMNEKLLEQKDKIQLLNRELNHRVKNNLAFMTSLLEMQMRRLDSEEARQALIESETRLKALALVHSQLFRKESDTEVNLKNYLEEIAGHLTRIFSTDDKPLKIKYNLADHMVKAEDAMRLGLIVNELVTNSVKHAFANISDPVINISTSLLADGKLQLQYKDNGPGIAAASVESDSSPSLGIKLIDLLRKQLGERYLVVV